MPLPSNSELFNISDRVLRLEALASPSLMFEEHYNTNTLLELKRFGFLVENYCGAIRTSGFEIQVSSGNIVITSGKCLFKEYILQYDTQQTITPFVAQTRKVILKVTQSRYTIESNPGDVGITIGPRTFSGPNQWRYSISFLYQSAAVPADTSTEFHLHLANVDSGGLVTMEVPLLADQRSWSFLKLTDTPSSYIAGKALRVNSGGSEIEYFDAAPLIHNHNDLYYTESEVDSLLATKSSTSHLHDDRYFTESEVTAFLSAKSDVGHNHNTLYYQISEIDSLLAAKADTTHTHSISQVTSLQSELDNRSLVSHTHTILSLSDVPNSFIASKYARVNSGGTAIEWADAITSFNKLSDGPLAYSGSTATSWKYVRVNGANNGVEYGDPLVQVVTPTDVVNNVYRMKVFSSDSTLSITHTVTAGAGATGAAINLDMKYNNPFKNFLALEDSPNSYSGHALKSIVVNSTSNALQFGVALASPESFPIGSVLVYKNITETIKGYGPTTRIRELLTSSSTGIEIIGHSVVSGDLAFSSATNGPILKDTNTGTSYRLKIVNGQLTIEAISPGVIPVSQNFGYNNPLS
jgi:hypothetical protein